MDDTIEGLVAVGAHPNPRDARPVKNGFRLDELPMNHAIREREWDAIEALITQGVSLDGLTIATGNARTLLTLGRRGVPTRSVPERV